MLKLHVAVFVWLVVSACSVTLTAPPPPPCSPLEPIPPHAPANSALRGDSARVGSAPAAPTPAVAPAPTAPPPPPCGLPPQLIARGWHRRLAPTLHHQPDPFPPGSVTLAVLPDTQVYTWCRLPHLAAQSSWLAEHAAERNVVAAVTLGDLTEHNSSEEWEFFAQGMKPLLDALPTVLVTGNHDQGMEGSATRRGTRLNEYFPTPPPATASVLAETLAANDLENAYYRIRLPKVTLGILALGWSPNARTVEWANDVLSRHRRDRVVVLTHAYLYNDSTRYDWKKKGPAQEWNPSSYGTSGTEAPRPGGALEDEAPTERTLSDEAFDGERLWNALVSRHPGIFLTLNGHVLGDGAGRLTSKGKAGNLVHQVLVNYQMLEEGGLGYLRLVEISPRGDELRMRTYSPSLGLWATDESQSFELPVSPPLWR